MNNNNYNTTNIQELNEAIRIELDRQDSVIKHLSNKFEMTENVIRNMLKEKRPVVRKNKHFTAFNVFIEDKNLQGKDNYENQMIWDLMSLEQKLSYQAEANKRNLENRYSVVKYIQNSEERLNVLKDGLRDLKYQCCRLNQECGWDFLVITIEPNEMPNASFGFGSLLTDDFCIEHPDDVLQLSKKLYQYGESRNSQMISKQQINIGNDRLESLMSQTPSLNYYQSSFTSESALMDNNDDIESGSSTSSLSSLSSLSSICMNSTSGEMDEEMDENLDINSESSSTDSEDLDESFETESDNETEDDDKTVCDDESDLADHDPIHKLLSQDYMNVHLDNQLKSAVRKFLKARFYADTGKNIKIPYKDWKKQTKYSISGWPENIKFEDWANIKDKREVYRHLLNVHFHVNEEAPEYLRISKKRRKIA